MKKIQQTIPKNKRPSQNEGLFIGANSNMEDSLIYIRIKTLW